MNEKLQQKFNMLTLAWLTKNKNLKKNQMS